MKRQPTEWEKVFAKHISDNWLISKTYNQNKQPTIIQLNSKKKEKKFQLKNRGTMGRLRGSVC